MCFTNRRSSLRPSGPAHLGTAVRFLLAFFSFLFLLFFLYAQTFLTNSKTFLTSWTFFEIHEPFILKMWTFSKNMNTFKSTNIFQIYVFFPKIRNLFQIHGHFFKFSEIFPNSVNFFQIHELFFKSMNFLFKYVNYFYKNPWFFWIHVIIKWWTFFKSSDFVFQNREGFQICDFFEILNFLQLLIFFEFPNFF